MVVIRINYDIALNYIIYIIQHDLGEPAIEAEVDAVLQVFRGIRSRDNIMQRILLFFSDINDY